MIIKTYIYSFISYIKKRNKFLSYTFTKTLQGETGCLNNLLYLLAAKGSSFFN